MDGTVIGPLRVLVVEDDPTALRLAVRVLGRDGHAVIEATTAEDAMRLLAEQRPDVLLLDVELPEMSGFELLLRMRGKITCPVIMMTGRGAESDRVLGLDLGADDYIVKPFLPREFAARVRAVARRFPVEAPRPAAPAAPRLQIRPPEREVLLDGNPVELTAREFDVLAYLMARPNVVISREELLREIWGSSAEWQDPATVTEHVRRLRRKLEPNPDEPTWLQTVRGVGYRYQP